MALTAKMLKGLGLTDEQRESILEAHADTVNEIKAERDRLKLDAEKLEAVQKELDNLKAMGDGGYKEKYEKEHKDFEDFKAAQTAKEARSAKESAFRNLLKDAGVNEKRIDSIVKVSDIDSLELEDGKIKGADKLTEAVKTEWADFIGAQNEPPIRVNMSGSLGGGKPESSPKSLSAALHEKYDK